MFCNRKNREASSDCYHRVIWMYAILQGAKDPGNMFGKSAMPLSMRKFQTYPVHTCPDVQETTKRDSPYMDGMY